jgi:two-component system, sensor histidine kinase LadS
VSARFQLIMLVLSLMMPLCGQAEAIWIDEAPTGPLGKRLQVWLESEPVSPDQARELAGAGRFKASARPVPALGIGAPPVWMRFQVDNPTPAAVPRVLLIGTSWLDRIDVYFWQGDQLHGHQLAGDRQLAYQPPVPGMGFLIHHDYAPGITEVLIRVESPDPLLVPVRLLTEPALASAELATRYSYGLLYGFLLALFAYNLMLYAGLRQSSHLNYSIYLASFILLNLAYTGHGYVWLWPAWPEVQRFVILLLMAVFACTGFRFARGFLGLREYAPRLDRAIRYFCYALMALMVLFILLGWQSQAALLAFSYVLTFSLGMLLLGWDAVRRQRPAGRYFLAAACCGMAGVAVTTMTVWGWLPYSVLGYRAVDVGLLFEATLLALAVAYLVREHERARQEAEQLARVDSLTGLLNRRAFVDQGERLWSAARRHQRPLSMLVLDLDHFKLINDLHGHETGDRVLREVALLLLQHCRQDDLAARWGGEEFVLLLPDTTLDHARALAERLRDALNARAMRSGDSALDLRASFGLASQDDQVSLDAMIREAESWLYRAKQGGRNQICWGATVRKPVG